MTPLLAEQAEILGVVRKSDFRDWTELRSAMSARPQVSPDDETRSVSNHLPPRRFTGRHRNPPDSDRWRQESLAVREVGW